MILQLVERRLAARLQQRAIERLARLERQPAFERGAMIGRQRLESVELDALDDDRLPFGDVQRDVDRGLIRRSAWRRTT